MVGIRLFCVAFALVVGVSATNADANTIVLSTNGTISTTQLKGTAGGLDVTLGATERVTRVNGAGITAIPVSFTLNPLHLVGTSGSFSGGTITETITQGSGPTLTTATITMNLTGSVITQAGTDVLSINGAISGVVVSGPGSPTYDWSQLVVTNFQFIKNGANSISGLFGHSALPAVTTAGSFSQSNVVPEPSSLALVSLGCVGLVLNSVRRRRLQK